MSHNAPAPTKISAGMTGTWGSTPPRVRRKRTNKEGQAISYMSLDGARCHSWVVVVWDGTDSPTCEPLDTLQFKHVGQRIFRTEVLL